MRTEFPRRPRPGRWLLGGLVVFVLIASSMPIDAQVNGDEYRPWLWKALLGRSKSIVLSRIDRVSALPNRARLVRLKVSRVLAGQERDKVVILGFPPALLRDRETAKIVFLAPTRNGAMRDVVDFVDLPATDAARRVEFLERMIAVAARRGDRERRQGVKELILGGVETPSPWVRRILVRELELLARRDARSFDATTLIRLGRMPSKDLPSADRRRLRHAIQLIEEANAVLWTHKLLLFKDDAAKASFLRDLTAFQTGDDPERRKRFLDAAAKSFGRRLAPLLVRVLDDREPRLQIHAAWLLGEVESGAGNEKLIVLARESENRELKRASIVALAKIAPPRAIEELKALVQRTEVAPLALRALAAINTGETALFLADYEATLEKDPRASPDLIRLIARLRGTEFQRELAEERSARQKIYPR